MDFRLPDLISMNVAFERDDLKRVLKAGSNTGAASTGTPSLGCSDAQPGLRTSELGYTFLRCTNCLVLRIFSYNTKGKDRINVGNKPIRSSAHGAMANTEISFDSNTQNIPIKSPFLDLLTSKDEKLNRALDLLLKY